MTCNSLEFSKPVITCGWCDKGAYTSRKAARQACRRHHPGKALNAYPCPILDGLWHYGTLPPGGRAQARRHQNAKLARWYT